MTPNKIEYSAVALNALGSYVHERIWGDWMNIQSDGHPTVEAAKERGMDFFDHQDVARVMIRESIQDFAGCSWRAGPAVAFLNRPEGA